MTRGMNFTGVSEIVRYNWMQYLAGICVVVALAGVAVAARRWGLPGYFVVAIATGAVLALWWLVASLAASWWVYDLSGVRPYYWLRKLIASPDKPWVYVHTGLDECGYQIKATPGAAPGLILDTFDSATMTEASVQRARRATAGERRPDAKCKWDAWPTPDEQFQTVYFIFAAHELRLAADREALFTEAARSLASGGEVVLVEHVRDWRNFCVYGPGFFHFWPEKEWDRLAIHAGLTIKHRGRKTGFVISRVYLKQTPERIDHE